MNADGTATDDFRTWLGLDTTDEISAPTNVTATDGTSSANVTVSWTSVTGASFYKVYRGTGSTFSAATLLGTSATTTYVDSTPTVDQVYYYWVVATNSAGDSSESTPDTGYAQSGGANSRTYTGNGTYTFTVPSGITSLVGCQIWAKGGDGGDRGAPPWGLPGTYNPGGAGGGGEFAISTIPVTPLESLTVIISSSGAAIQRSSTVLMSCVSGSNGAAGGTGAGAGGAGGTGGSFDGTVTTTTRNAGSAGTAGSGSSGGTGGATTPVETGFGTGGNGSGTASSNATVGSPAKVVINW